MKYSEIVRKERNIRISKSCDKYMAREVAENDYKIWKPVKENRKSDAFVAN